MAILQQQDGSKTQDLHVIQDVLSALNVELKYWPINTDSQELYAQPTLTLEQKEQLTQAHDHYFAQLQKEAGYQTRDIIVLHPEIPSLETLLQKFSRIHTHDDDEVRYIVDGAGIFGFVLPDARQILLTVEAGDYINVPKDTEHWFVLTSIKRIKALRYFTTTEGWTPRYTDRPITITP